MPVLVTEDDVALAIEAEAVDLLQVACQPMVSAASIDCDCEPISNEYFAALIAQASDLIAIFTGGKVAGVCTDTVRPCANGACVEASWCSPDTILLLGPNTTVSQIKIDGAALDPSSYRLVDGTGLVRTDGKRWPTHQDLTLDDTEPDTFSVTYSHGQLPFLAVEAAREIVCDMLKRDPNQGRARQLPAGARSATVGGVTIQLEQQMWEYQKRAMLLPSVVRLLNAYAPDGPTPTAVYSPELDTFRLHQT